MIITSIFHEITMFPRSNAHIWNPGSQGDRKIDDIGQTSITKLTENASKLMLVHGMISAR